MSDHGPERTTRDVVRVMRPEGASGIVLVCEHASHHVPSALRGLGLPEDMRCSHAAWDPGALGVAEGLSERLDAPLVASRISRLVYDCNRPPEAPSAILQESEGREIPGNKGLDDRARADRVARYYLPFETRVRAVLDQARAEVLVTVHSFTPVFMGTRRDVEIGVLTDEDTRLADAMLARGAQHTPLRLERNAPYGLRDGVMHTLRVHGLTRGIPNVMIELRNDLIATPETQAEMAGMLAGWIRDSLGALEAAA